VIEGLAQAGMNTTPLWWAVVFGAGFGGNATIIGSTANIIVAGFSEKTHTPITTKIWSRYGPPVMLVTCSIISVLYVLAYPWFSRR
jgi:Na+/H+ antiporter NhaD/arsenite permease-like protein